MTWIAKIACEDATGKLRQLYERIKGPDDNVDNIMLAHSLRPHTMEGHMTLYKNVIHHPRNTLPKWLLETVGVYVSLLNRCRYCVEHHYAGLQKLIGDDDRSRCDSCVTRSSESPSRLSTGANWQRSSMQPCSRNHRQRSTQTDSTTCVARVSMTAKYSRSTR